MVPTLLLCNIMTASFSLLYSLEYLENPLVTIKVIGHQWYWTYEFAQLIPHGDLTDEKTLYANISMDSYMVPVEDCVIAEEKGSYDLRLLEAGVNIALDSHVELVEDSVIDEDKGSYDLRLLEVDNALLLPVRVMLRFVFTGADVIHSWAVPSMGIKTDCIPGRLNQTPLYITRRVQTYGQCSELCGINHGFMPICVVTG